MEFKISDWIVNEGNVFELPDSHYYINYIQKEILEQLQLRQQTAEIAEYHGLKVNSVKDFLNVMIDVTKSAGNGSSIKHTLFAWMGDLSLIDKVLNQEVYKALKNALLHKYYDTDCKALLPLRDYRFNYDKFATNYILNSLNATEINFIESELRLCTRIEMELKKPVYDRLDYLGVINSFGDNQGSYFKNTMQPIIIERRAYLNEKLNSLSTTIDAPQFDTKKLRPPIKAIRFSEQQVKEKFLQALSGCFDDSDATALEKAIDGNILTEPLLFPHNQNKLVEVFRRAKYNGFILNKPVEIKNWLCSNFQFVLTKGTATEVKGLNSSTVHDILTKGKSEPSKGERICVTDWLPYKSPMQLKQASQNEKTKKT